MAAERFSNLNRKHRLLAATKREQTIQYNITITDKEILVYIYYYYYYYYYYYCYYYYYHYWKLNH